MVHRWIESILPKPDGYGTFRYIPEAMSEQHRKLAHLFGAQDNSEDRAMHAITPTDTKRNDPRIGSAMKTDGGEITKEITAQIIP